MNRAILIDFAKYMLGGVLWTLGGIAFLIIEQALTK